jgi:hypothetical protein
MKREKYIFFGVLFFGFVIQLVPRTLFYFGDKSIWADQLRYFLNNDPRMFDFYLAYGHPGTVLLELGIVFHVLLGVSYATAMTLGESILIAAATAACSVLCFLLYRRSLWWLAAACTLLLNRMYMHATEPTAVVMPLVVLIVLATWWLWERQERISKWHCFLLGTVMGLAAASRLDAGVLVSLPMFLLMWHRHGRRIVLPLFAGAGISFFMADPFLWFMPIQHITDLVRKFTLHYTRSYPSRVQPFTMDTISFVDAMWLSAVSFAWSLILFRRQRLARILPIPVMIVFFIISAIAMVVVFSSKFQVARYLYPLMMVWEVFLPLFILETLNPTNRRESVEASPQRSAISLSVISISILMQLPAYLTLFITVGAT